ncbi:TPA: aspartate 1-decarboxylase [candidate division WOR-3 bacterium]|jgi:aspartate 1-decarboxylase|uniref:Aspartate 1-decarboxylase n=1 Tax=candidate division WOR-3 bacterium TaxID=2052148 RepID=A0A350H8D7_UNCW3|nr:aspartate 1-decarboxylase [candidate division WOR-3 bacterium]
MNRIMLKSKIHNAIVTVADINYEGSISIDRDIMDASNILHYEKVLVIDKENGERFETYVIEAKRGSKEIGVNGGAARLVQRGDRLIVMSFSSYSEEELKSFSSKIVILNKNNEITDTFTRGI